MTNFSKNQKSPFHGAILCPLCLYLGKNKFSCKKGLCQFLNIPIIYHCTRETNRQISRQTENGNFIGASVRRESKMKNKRSQNEST